MSTVTPTATPKSTMSAQRQQEFMKTVQGLAVIAAAEANEGGFDGVTKDTVLSELVANLLTCVIVSGDNDLMVAITLKAESQAAEIRQRRAERMQAEMDLAARANSARGNA